jgi:hypothetical protein
MLRLHLSQHFTNCFEPVLTRGSRYSFHRRDESSIPLRRLLLLSLPLRLSVQQNLTLFFFFFFRLVIGSGSGSVFIRRSGLAILHHGLLDLPALLFLRLEQHHALIQVIKKKADGRGAGLSYPCSKLNDEVGDDPGPVHLPSFIQCSKDGVTHGNSYPVRLFWIKDGDEERKDTPMPGIRAIFDGVSILGAWQLLEAVLHVLILPSCQSATSRAEIIHLPPTLLRPPGWCCSD